MCFKIQSIELDSFCIYTISYDHFFLQYIIPIFDQNQTSCDKLRDDFLKDNPDNNRKTLDWAVNNLKKLQLSGLMIEYRTIRNWLSPYSFEL